MFLKIQTQVLWSVKSRWISIDNAIATHSVIGGALNSNSDHIEWDCWIIYDPLESLGSTYGIQYVCKEPFRNVSTRLLTSLARNSDTHAKKRGKLSFFTDIMRFFTLSSPFSPLLFVELGVVCVNKSPALKIFLYSFSSKFETYRAFTGKPIRVKNSNVKEKVWTVKMIPDILNIFLVNGVFAGSNW